jgi:RHS repeat-associated protein
MKPRFCSRLGLLAKAFEAVPRCSSRPAEHGDTRLQSPWLQRRAFFCGRLALTAAFSFFFLLWIAHGVRAGLGNDNPSGPAGDYNGSVTSAGYYDPFTGNAKRVIEDITVPGSVGAYPLKWTRYLNTRGTSWPQSLGQGGAWTHSYSWGLSILPPPPPEHEPAPEGMIRYPDGRTVDLYNAGGGFYLPMRRALDQVSEFVQDLGGGRYDLFLGDGGKVKFRQVNGIGIVPFEIVDPYGLTTTLTWVASPAGQPGRLVQVIQLGGRYLQINYITRTFRDNWGNLHTYHLIDNVKAYDRTGGTVIETVSYTYTEEQIATAYGYLIVYDLTGVDYSDGTQAAYTYQASNVTQADGVAWRLVRTCDDVRYDGPMRQIKYEYVGPGEVAGGASWGQIKAEKNKITNEIVSEVTYPPSGQSPNTQAYYRRTETRGDGQTRVFQYGWGVSGTWAIGTELVRYTDFQSRSKNIVYSFPNNVIRKSVTDPRGNTTHIDRAGGLISKITYPGAYVEYTYNTYYLASSRNELGKVTTHERDGNNRIQRTIYPSDANTPASSEEFSYNNFGQVLTHHLKNGKYQHFQYDGRGLLTAKWNPTANATPVGSDPKTTYTYYTAADGRPGWIDRVKTETLPANVSGLQASKTYEYDKNANGAAVPGRGLVTMIKHADNKYQAFGYDAYGNKLWEENELRQRTTYTYDAYKRVLTARNPLNKTTTYSYELTNGNQNLPATLHTTASVRLITTHTGITTENRYDENFRKISTKEAYGTALAATTTFDYDEVGNLTWVTDPLLHKTFNRYDARNRKDLSTAAWGTALATTTTWTYDAASNVTIIGRPDGTTETKGYDALNRVIWNNVVRQVPGGGEVNLTNWLTYNPSGTIQAVRDPGAKVTTFQYDASDRKTKMIYPNNTHYQQWTYDGAGNLASRRTVGNKTQSFTYDIRNRKITMTWSNSAEWAYFAYDDASRLVTAKNGTGAWNTNIISDVIRAYDAAGRLTSDQQNVTGLGSKNVTYPWYDDDGKLKRIYLGGGGYDYTFSYDAMGRFEKISPTGGAVAFQYVYDAASNETERHRFNGPTDVGQFYTRDSLNRMSRLDVKRDTTPLSAEVYTYDRMSRLTVANRWPENKQDLFGYYWNGEMYWAQYGVTGLAMPGEGGDPDQDMPDTTDPWAGWSGNPEAEDPPPPPDQGEPSPPAVVEEPDVPMDRWVNYFLDNAGNRTRVVDTGVHKLYTPNNLNQYTQAESLGVSNGGEHEVSSYQNVAYTYRNNERLIGVTGGGNNYFLAYDALGRCVKRTLNGVTTYYIYDGEKPIVEYNSGGALVGRNVYGKGIDEILHRAYGAQSYYFQQDRNGNVTQLTDISGAIVEQYRYDAFGALTIVAPNGTERSTSAYNNRFLFTGREYAATFGFYEYRARAYNPTLGRFMTEDPKGFDAGDYNLFRYCHNDPLDLIDPMGLEGGVQPQPGDHPLPGPVATLPAPLGSNIPIRITIDAKLIEYATARGVNIGQGQQARTSGATANTKLSALAALAHYIRGSGTKVQTGFNQLDPKVRAGDFTAVQEAIKQAQQGGGDVTAAVSSMKPHATKGFNNKATFGNVILQIDGVVTAQSSGSYNFKGALSALNDRYDFNPQPLGVRTIPAEISTRFGALLPGRPYGIEFVGSRAIDESGP